MGVECSTATAYPWLRNLLTTNNHCPPFSNPVTFSKNNQSGLIVCAINRTARKVWPVVPASSSMQLSAVSLSVAKPEAVLHENPIRTPQVFLPSTCSLLPVKVLMPPPACANSNMSAYNCRKLDPQQDLMKSRFCEDNSAEKA